MIKNALMLEIVFLLAGGIKTAGKSICYYPRLQQILAEQIIAWHRCRTCKAD